jgi:spore photoproduct lyase
MSSDSVDVTQPLAPGTPAAPHSASGEAVALHDLGPVAPAPRPARRWTPKRVVATPAAYDHPHGRRIMALVEAEGIEVERLRGNRLTGLRGENDRQTYARAKATMAIVVSPPSRRKLQPIAPIIAVPDWRASYGELLDNIADAV